MNESTIIPTVFISGASSGIGRATALELDRRGMRVLASVRRQEDAEALQAEASPRLTPVMLEITDAASIARAQAQVAEIVGDAGLNGLVNNAGNGVGGPLEFVPLDKLRHLYEVHVFGLLALTQALLPHVRAARGRIVNMSSSATIHVVPFHGPYSSAKLSINGISDALRGELRPHGVSVSNIICGSIDTPIWKKGRQNSQGLMASLPAEARELYGQNWQTLGDYFAEMGNKGRPPQLVAKAIVHALTARRPKRAYYVGPDAQLFRLFNFLLPVGLYSAIVRRVIGLS